MKKYSEAKIYLIFFIAIAILLGIGIIQARKKLYAPTYPQNKVSQSVEISQEELRAFLNTVIKYKQENADKDLSSDLSFSTASSLAEENKFLASWVEEHGWNAKRFFYIETRVRTIISTILKDRAIEARKDLMNESAETTKSASLAVMMQEEAKAQQKNLNIEQISKAEREMIAPQLKEIAELIGQEVY